MKPELVRDLAAGVGLALVGVGVGLKDVAVALMVVGGLLLAIVVVGAWLSAASSRGPQQRERSEPSS